MPEVLRELCARRDNHLFVGVAGVCAPPVRIWLTPQLLVLDARARTFCFLTSESEVAGIERQDMRVVISNSTFSGFPMKITGRFGQNVSDSSQPTH